MVEHGINRSRYSHSGEWNSRRAVACELCSSAATGASVSNHIRHKVSATRADRYPHELARRDRRRRNVYPTLQGYWNVRRRAPRQRLFSSPLNTARGLACSADSSGIDSHHRAGAKLAGGGYGQAGACCRLGTRVKRAIRERRSSPRGAVEVKQRQNRSKQRVTGAAAGDHPKKLTAHAMFP